MLKSNFFEKLYRNIDNARYKMILLFGEKAQDSFIASKNSKVKNTNNPVENSGILAFSGSDQLGFLNASEYDDFISSNPVAINYAAYSEWEESNTDCGFMSDFSNAVATLSQGEGYTSSFDSFGGEFAGACTCSCDCSGGFSSVC